MQTRTLNERYRLDELIGEGGMAVVHRGYDLVLNRVVAIKVLRDQYASDENFLRRFEREAQSAARLSHPNIANVYDVGQDRHTRYIVMEYVDGPNLKELIRRQGPFSVEGAAFVIRQVADALDYAHAHGLVHRDIKPQNILVDQHGTVKVVDFGIAKGISDSNLTEAGTGMGTVHYVSPEQARGETATPASDVYATGIVLYEMLTKRLPFEADTPVGIAMQHVNVEPVPPSQYNPAIPPEVEQIVLRALAKDPADRFPSAGALAEALDIWEQGGQPTQAVSVSQATRMMPTQAGASAPTAAAPRRRPARAVAGRATPPPPPPRAQTFRDDIGCVTWLIGSAILIGLIGLVVLAFKLGDGNFGFFDQSNRDQATATATLPVAAATPTLEPTPTVTGTPTVTPTPSATPEPTPSPEPTPEMITVPSLIGSTLEQAQFAAQSQGFTLIEERVYHDTTPVDTIVSQDPPAGELREKGSQILVRISRGPDFISLQGIVGLPRAQARQRLEQQGLTVTEIEQASPDVPQGQVIRTDPENQVRPGGTVTLYVSMGSQVVVPNVYGQTLDLAMTTLQNAGLVVTAANPQSCSQIQASDPSFDCDTFPDQGVVSGTLPWDTWVPRSSRITIAYYDASLE